MEKRERKYCRNRERGIRREEGNEEGKERSKRERRKGGMEGGRDEGRGEEGRWKEMNSRDLDTHLPYW